MKRNKQYNWSGRVYDGTETNNELNDQNVYEYEFRNKSDGWLVEINGMRLYPGDTFREFLLENEKTHGQYNFRWLNITGVPPVRKEFLVFEKRPVGEQVK